MTEFTIEQVNDIKDTPVEELSRLNQELGGEHKKYLENYDSLTKAIIICADSRVPEDAVNNGEFIVVANAGNILDPDYHLPTRVDSVFVIGHENENKSEKGCGAVDAARMEKEKIEGLREDDPDLYQVAIQVKPGIRENIEATVEALKQRGYKNIGKGMYNHTEGTVYELEGPQDMIESILEANKRYMERIHEQDINSNPEKKRSIKNGQNPRYVVLNSKGPGLKNYLKEGANVPDFIFEITQPGKHVAEDSKITSISKGSHNYGLDHFKGPNVGIVVAEDETDLERVLNDQTTNAIFERYIDQGKQMFGVIPHNKTHELTFYSINKK